MAIVYYKFIIMNSDSAVCPGAAVSNVAASALLRPAGLSSRARLPSTMEAINLAAANSTSVLPSGSWSAFLPAYVRRMGIALGPKAAKSKRHIKYQR